MRTFISRSSDEEENQRSLKELEKNISKIQNSIVELKKELEPELSRWETVKETAIAHHNKAAQLLANKFATIKEPNWQQKITLYQKKLLYIAQRPMQASANQAILKLLTTQITSDLTTIPESFKPQLAQLQLISDILTKANTQMLTYVRETFEIQTKLNEHISNYEAILIKIRGAIRHIKGDDMEYPLRRINF